MPDNTFLASDLADLDLLIGPLEKGASGLEILGNLLQ